MQRTPQLIRRVAQIVQKLLGGRFGRKRKDVAIPAPNYRRSYHILDENVIQAVTILI
jgi:hypothetical protein|tara:strand:- start:540 stop:710 length:171 start_codon:yes stop_codon:yes gene_type:complete